MDRSRLERELRELLDHMGRVGYSRGYVADARRLAGMVLEHATEWDCWADAAGWVAGWVAGGHGCASTMSLLEAMRRYDEEGILPRTDGARPRRKARARDTLSEGFACVLEAYESAASRTKRPSTVEKAVSNASSFLSRVEARGPKSPPEVTEEDVLAVLTGPDGGPAYSASHVCKVREVLSAASDEGVEGCASMASYLPVPRRWRRVGPCLSAEEAGAVDSALDDPGNGLTLRDRAIGRLLLHTGMRPCDVAGMRTDSVDWSADEISVVQQKTGQPLALPLTPKVGNAIFDYATSERGGSDDPHLFLSTEWPYSGLSAAAVYKTSCAVLDAAGLRRGEGDARGTRLFRRRAATAMLGGGVDRAVAASVLGQTDARTTERYMQADVEGLREHASLDVTRFAPSRKGAV